MTQEQLDYLEKNHFKEYDNYYFRKFEYFDLYCYDSGFVSVYFNDGCTGSVKLIALEDDVYVVSRIKDDWQKLSQKKVNQ